MSLTRSRPSHAPSRIRPCASSAAAGHLQAAFRPGTLAARASVGKEPSRFPRAGAGHAKYPSAAATIPLIGEWRANMSDVGGVSGTTQSSLAVAINTRGNFSSLEMTARFEWGRVTPATFAASWPPA
jgi:hypothetical protein